jgi:hypothetical protein
MWMPIFASSDALIKITRLTTMNLFLPFLLAAKAAHLNQVPEMRSRCDWTMDQWASTGLMSSSMFILLPLLSVDTTPSRSLALVDDDGTLHAQLDVRLTQYIPPIPPASPDQSDARSQISSVGGTVASSSNSDTAQSPTDTPHPLVGKSKRDRKANDRDKSDKKPVYTTLRRGGR